MLEKFPTTEIFNVLGCYRNVTEINRCVFILNKSCPFRPIFYRLCKKLLNLLNSVLLICGDTENSNLKKTVRPVFRKFEKGKVENWILIVDLRIVNTFGKYLFDLFLILFLYW